MAAAILASAPCMRGADNTRQAAPFYSVASIVNSGTFTAGALAPNSLATIFGTDLAFKTAAASPDDAGLLPRELANTQVFAGGLAVPLFYVSETQINLVMPPGLTPGDVKIRVVRQGVAGPDVTVTVLDAAPALFRNPAGYAVATHANGTVITPEAPAQGGEVVVVYAAGLGGTDPVLPREGAPIAAASILRPGDLRLLLDGTAVDSSRIAYAGATPRSLGLYQVNVTLPEVVATDPEIRIVMASQTSAAGLKLATR